MKWTRFTATWKKLVGTTLTAGFIAIVLAGCSANHKPVVAPPATPAGPADMVAMIFSTQGGLISGTPGNGTKVTDSCSLDAQAVMIPAPPCSADGTSLAITRKTVTDGYQWQGELVETWSQYSYDPVANCIRNLRDETRLQSSKGIVATQVYDGSPCWAPATVSAANSWMPYRGTPTITGTYTWTHWDGGCTAFANCTTANALAASAHGSFTDWVSVFAVNKQITEYYLDTTGIDPGPADPYCTQGQYGGPGLIVLSNGSC